MADDGVPALTDEEFKRLPRRGNGNVDLGLASAKQQARFYAAILAGSSEVKWNKWKVMKKLDSWTYRFKGKAVRRKAVFRDYQGKLRRCWVVCNRNDSVVGQLQSVPTYRLAIVHRYRSLRRAGKEEEAGLLRAELSRLGKKGGLVARHLCGNGECVRPSHLRIGTSKQNNFDTHFHRFTRFTDADDDNQTLRTLLWKHVPEFQCLW